MLATIYGGSGVGKTTLLNTMPGQGLVLDIPQIEGGTMVLSDTTNIDVFDIDTWDHFEEGAEALRQGMVSPITNKPYQWVGIDTITAAQELAKRKVLAERGISSAPQQITQQNWGQIGQLMSELFYQYASLNLHVIFLSQERLRETADIAEYQPAISPMSLDALHPPQFLIGRLSVVDVFNEEGAMTQERRLRVQPSERYLAKVRSVPGRQLKPVLRNPNLKQIFGWLLGSPNAIEPEGIVIEKSTNPFAVQQE